jgi:hypothetical protein
MAILSRQSPIFSRSTQEPRQPGADPADSVKRSTGLPHPSRFASDGEPMADDDAASNQALVGTNRVFYTRVDGNKLTVKTPVIVIPTTGLTSVVQLEFVKAE